MNSLSVNLHHSNNNLPIEIIFSVNKIYNNIVKIAESTIGFIVLIPILIGVIVTIPISYILIGIIFTYCLFSLIIKRKSILKEQVTVESYKEFYDLYLYTKAANEDLRKLDLRMSSLNKKLLLFPFSFFIKNFRKQCTLISETLESRLFEEHSDEKISPEDLEYFRSQLTDVESDWDDEKMWADFQTSHHHLLC
jgi:hypothetical protein